MIRTADRHRGALVGAVRGDPKPVRVPVVLRVLEPATMDPDLQSGDRQIRLEELPQVHESRLQRSTGARTFLDSVIGGPSPARA